MRHTISILIILVLMGGTIATAQTQIPINEPIEKFRRYFGTGISVPTGSLEDGGRRGFHFWGRIGYTLTPTTELSIGPEYHTFDRDNRGQFGTYGGRLYTLMLGVNIKRNLGADPEFMNPYLFAGGGWAFMEVLPLTTIARGKERFESANGVYLEGGFGLELGWILLQVKVVRVAKRYIGDRLTHFPFSVGLRF